MIFRYVPFGLIIYQLLVSFGPVWKYLILTGTIWFLQIQPFYPSLPKNLIVVTFYIINSVFLDKLNISLYDDRKI
jgi:hypothetical protein